jgi:ankyrin repeat protein
MKKIFIVMVMGLFLLSCSNRKRENILTVEEMKIPYSMVEQSIDLDDSMSLDLFLQSGFDPNYKNENGETLLMYTVKSNSFKSLKILLEYDVNLETETSLEEIEGTTAHKAKKRAIDYVKSKKILDILIDEGADIDYINNLGEPLIIKFIKEKPDTYTKELILKGAKLDVTDSEKWTPLMWAASKNDLELVKELIANGADINRVDSRKNLAIYYAYDELIIQELLTPEMDKRYKNKDGENVLGEVYLRAISNSYYNIVEKIIKLGGDKNYSSYGDTPLGIARENKDEKMIELLKSLGVEK